MNKRQEPVSIRVNKKNSKEVHKVMEAGDLLPPKKAKKAIIVPSLHPQKKPLKKHSKRTSPGEKIENSSPAHCHTENEHWERSLRKHIDINRRNLTKKLSKKH